MDVFIGTVMSFAFSYAPKGWATCSGQLISIQSNQALFSLMGTTFGGDGRNTFGLPNLQGRSIVGQGTDTGGVNWAMGQAAGTAQTTLQISQIPPHVHSSSTNISIPALADSAGTTDPTSAVFAISSGANTYSNAAPDTTLKPFQENLVVDMTGGSIPFNNISPYQVVNYSIALYGLFPSRD